MPPPPYSAEFPETVLLVSVSPPLLQSAADFLDLDAALNELAGLDERQAQIVEMRYYGGLSIAEVAAVMGVSDALRTVTGRPRAPGCFSA